MSTSRRILQITISGALLAVLTISYAGAQRAVIPEPVPPHPVIQRDLTLLSMRVDINIDGATARTTLRQTLRNDGHGMAEGRYLLPLPPGATVSDFALVDGDNRLTGEVLDAGEARQIYQEIVRTMRDPGLLEYQDHNTFSVSVFPFNPGDERTVEVTFAQTLTGTGDMQSYYLPLKWAGWSRCRDVSFVLDYEIDSQYELGTISSPTHGISVNRDGDYSAHGSCEETLDDFASDFALHIGRRTAEFAASLMCFPGEDGEDGYFLLSLLAALPEDDEYVPKDVLFIFDKSGSMAGEKIEQAKGGLRFVVDRLKREDRFGLVYYDDVIYTLWDELRQATDDNVREARRNVDELTDGGSTDIDSALRTGAEIMGSSERPQYVVFLTDGLPTAGECDIDNIVGNAKDAFDGDVKVFVFGVGNDVNTTLLDSLSYNHHGSATYVGPSEDIEAKVSEFYAKMSSPALIDVALEFDGLRTRDIMPRELPDLFHNHEIHISGRFRGTPNRSVHVTLLGDTQDGRQKFMTDVDTNLSTANHTIPRLWATRKVSYLLDQIRLLGDDPELLDEVDKLAMRFGIVTPYTSYLITEPDMYFDDVQRSMTLGVELEEAREDQSGAMAVGRSRLNQANQAADAAAAPQSAGKAAGGGAGYRDEISYNVNTDYYEAQRRSGSADPYTTVNYVNNQTFVQQTRDAGGQQWTDARYDADRQDVIQVTSYGDVYFQLLDEYPELGEYLSQGEQVTLVLSDDLALQTVSEEVSNTSAEVEQLREALGEGDYLADGGDRTILAGPFSYFPPADNGGLTPVAPAATVPLSAQHPRRDMALRIALLVAAIAALAGTIGILGLRWAHRLEHPRPPVSPSSAV